jgi:glycosyltransferase involved in cell wall biosynthesis
MPRRVPILAFVTSFCVGGTERQFANLVHGLRARGDFDVHVGCFRAEGPLRAELCDGEHPVREYPFPSLKSPQAARQLVALARYLVRHRIAIVHTTGMYPNIFAVTAAWLARTPLIVASIRDLGHMWSPGLRRMQRLTCRLADVVVTNADAIAQRLRSEGYDSRRVVIVRNGVVWEAPSGPPGAVRGELGIPPAAPLVGTICRVDRVKGLESFIDAAALVVESHPEARFLVVGPRCAETGDEYIAELRGRAERAGLAERLILTGARTDVPQLLRELDVSVLSTLSEGLSNALLESMAAGTPVVATAVGGNPELVRDGVTGLLVPPADAPALASAIARLLDSRDLATRLAIEGRKMVDERFGFQRMVDETVSVYRRALRARGERGGAAEESPATGALRLARRTR